MKIAVDSPSYMKIQAVLKKAFASILPMVTGLALPLSLLGAPSPEVLTLDNPRVQEVIAVQNLFTKDLMAQPEILGTAVGQDEDGEVVMMIFVNVEASNHGEVMRALPASLRGKRVRPELTDPFRAFARGGGVSHTAKQTPPIQLGTSGGWRYDLANSYCCGGTLGSLVQAGGGKYILSNYHVFESDIVSGGNNRVATTGDYVTQPGLIDVGCNAANAQNVATLVKSSSLPNNNVDASIAEIIPGMVREDGAILEIGTISKSTVGALVNQAVKKSGRTSGLTRSKVTGLNATISVSYENECAGGTAFTKTYTGQIVIVNTGSKFLKGGDSGSLMVEDVTTNPRAVGLLFAGSSFQAIANPIDDVLRFFGATMVGK
jgi:hypothetical protein